MSEVVICEDVVKSYGGLRAVDGATFSVRRGEIFGMLGPNGAGKTTLMECIEGMRSRDSGRIEVLGLDPQRDATALRHLTGVQLQSSALPLRIRVIEALELFASFYSRPADPRSLLARLGLSEKAGSFVESLSGGQRQRVFVALALINRPQVVFLDELTTGLDPQARLAIWDVIREIRDDGTTVFLSTHYMEEAERLCDRVAVLDRGRIIALDSVTNLIASLGAPTQLSFKVDGEPPIRQLEHIAGVTRVEHTVGRIIVHGTGERFPQEVIGALTQAGLLAREIRTEQATLETAYLALTDRQVREGRAA